MEFQLVQEVINAEHWLKASMASSDIALHQSGLLSIASIELSDSQRLVFSLRSNYN
ncbi:hypothetical protein [uncultured Vibrio sp.]|uniref:hypothetical protein n=1 Tax=uncultured Vibrio sp. TaxID=114054 RepID=UPI002614E031|nr:hypothetical protein [uncultured Vibrio sp.]